jgi:hypothetical protein
MTFILSKKSKPKLVDNTILNQITKQNLLKKQLINVNYEKSKYETILITVHDKCIEYLTNYFWIIFFILIIIIILWCRYKWYKKSLKNNKNYHNKIYKKNINQEDINKNYQEDMYQNYEEDINQNYQNYQNFQNKQNSINQEDINQNYQNFQYKQNINSINQEDNYQYFQDKQNNINQEDNNEITKFDTKYTNKKDIKYNIKDTNVNVKSVNFDTINNTFFDPVDNSNSNFSYI